VQVFKSLHKIYEKAQNTKKRKDKSNPTLEDLCYISSNKEPPS